MVDPLGVPGGPQPEFYAVSESRFGRVVCYNQTVMKMVGDHKGGESGSALTAALPFFVTQLCVANLSYRVLYYFTRPLHLPPFVAQILVSIQSCYTYV